MDRINLWEGLLGDMSTALWAVLTYKDGIFYLDKKKWRDKLDKLSFAGANGLRVLPYSLYGVESREKVFCPWVYDKSLGLFHLRKFSNNYFDIIEEAVLLAGMPQPKGPNMAFGYELFDDCGFRPNVIHLNPLSNNIQGISTMYDETEELYLFVNEVIVRLAGKVKIMLGNELNMPMANARSMFGRIFSMFKLAGVEVFSYGTCVNVPAEEASNSPLKGMQMEAETVLGVNEMVRITRPVHNIALGNQYINYPCYWWGRNAHAAFFSDDGVNPRPTPIMWQDMTRYILDNFSVESHLFNMGGKVRLGFEHCAKTENWNYEASVISGIAQEIEKNFGPGTPANITLENRGKTIEPYQEPAPPTPPEPPVPPEPPTPPDPGFDLCGWIKNRKWFILGLVLLGGLIWLALKLL